MDRTDRLSDAERERLDGISHRIIGCAFEVGNRLGHGFLEKVHENALAIELRRAGLEVERQKRLEIQYRDELIGDTIADLVVEKSVVVEIKSIRAFDDSHIAQCLNYLKATGLRLCSLINFGRPRVDHRRIVDRF